MAQLTEAQQHQLIALLDEQEARLHRQLTELESVSPADAEPAVEPTKKSTWPTWRPRSGPPT